MGATGQAVGRARAHLDLVLRRPQCNLMPRFRSQHREVKAWFGWHLRSLHCIFLQEEQTMLEDIWVTLSELKSVTFYFKQLDKNCVTSE